MPGRRLAILISSLEAVVTESRYAAGTPGADPHIHCLHADIFHIVAGALEFLVGPDHAERSLGAGDTVLVPPGLVHGFRVAADADTVYVNAHAPGMGFDVYLRERRSVPEAQLEAFFARHDIYDEPPDGGLPADRVVISPDGLVQTWRQWAPPGSTTDRAAEAMSAGLAACLARS